MAGDALLNKAYELMIKASIDYPGKEALLAMDAIASCAGTEGMIGASCRFNFRRSPSRFRYYKFYSQKQNSCNDRKLIKAGAILGQASKEEIEALANLGYCIGMAFQIQDDILDITGDEKELGKAINSDLKTIKQLLFPLKA